MVVNVDSGIPDALPSSGPQSEIGQVLTNELNIVQTVTYLVTPTSGTDGNCEGDPFNVTVDVDPVPSIGNIILDPICSGEGFTVSPENGLGVNSDDVVPSNTTYTWTVLDSSGPT